MSGTVVSIGNFDGVHVGHRALLVRARAMAPKGSVIAWCFDPHPMSVLRPGSAPGRLSTFEQRSAWLQAAGADEVRRLEPTQDLLGQSPEGFLTSIRTAHPDLTGIVEGPDFRFGRGRAAGVEELRSLGGKMGVQVSIVEPVEVVGSDQLLARASSSLIRWFVAHGRMADAARVLGRPYEIVGTVVQGDRRGRTIGFPTANVQTEQLLPADGVYAAECVLPEGRVHAMALSVGTKPHFDGVGRTLEGHILEVAKTASGAIVGLEEYGWTIRIRVLDYLRDQSRYGTLEELIEQIERDCARTAACAAWARNKAWVGSERAVLA